jgi:hypothetical protein
MNAMMEPPLHSPPPPITRNVAKLGARSHLLLVCIEVLLPTPTSTRHLLCTALGNAEPKMAFI